VNGSAARGPRGGHAAIVAYVAWALACVAVVLARDGRAIGWIP
jgi:hypothetical protein